MENFENQKFCQSCAMPMTEDTIAAIKVGIEAMKLVIASDKK